MRIATATIFENQTASIDNLVFQQQQLGNELSTGKALNQPSDDPTQIGEDLSLRAAIASENTLGTNLQNAVSQLTMVDGSLSSLTNILQSARQLAIEGASDTLSTQQRQAIGAQIDQLLSEAIGIANTSYGGRYVFAGTSSTNAPPVEAHGSPVSSVTFSGNFESQSEVTLGGQKISISTSLQEAFNFDATNGSPDVFQTLINLRDTLDAGTVVDQSATSVNQQGTVIGASSTLGPGPNQATLTTALTPDSTGQYTIVVDGGSGSVSITFLPTDTIATMISKINAATGTTGVTATFDAKTQRLSLSSQNGQPFTVTDAPSAGATNSANFVEAFGLTTNADLVQTDSTQLNDVDNVLNVALKARAVIGGRIDALNRMIDQNNQSITDNTQEQSQIEDANIAQTVTQFSQTQTALQAAYSTTAHLESKILFDYITTA